VRRSRASRFVFDRDRDRFIARRVVLRGLLAEQMHCAPADIAIEAGPNGKPELRGARHEDIHFNCSHSSGLALFALAHRTRIGVDMERVRPVSHLAEIGRHYFTRREWSVIDAAPSRRARLFFCAWTLKEAYLKATGEGLSRSPETIELEFGPDGTPRLCAVDGKRCLSAQWWARVLSPAAGFLGTVVVERR
jgi:4'-phosphopantetheinyl transferase